MVTFSNKPSRAEPLMSRAERLLSEEFFCPVYGAPARKNSQLVAVRNSSEADRSSSVGAVVRPRRRAARGGGERNASWWGRGWLLVRWILDFVVRVHSAIYTLHWNRLGQSQCGFMESFMVLNIINYVDMVRRENDRVSCNVRKVSSP